MSEEKVIEEIIDDQNIELLYDTFGLTTINECKYALIFKYFDGSLYEILWIPEKYLHSTHTSENTFDVANFNKKVLVDIITFAYGTPHYEQKINVFPIVEEDVQYSHIWNSKDLDSDKEISIGILGDNLGYFSIMEITQSSVNIKKRVLEKAERDQIIKEYAQDF